MHCDNCAGNLPTAYVSGIVYNESVILCSGRCVAELLRVWAPSRRVWPWRQALMCLAVLATLL